MKAIFLAGGLTGFVIAGAAGWWAGRAPDRVFLDCMLGCMIGAFSFRWFWSVVLSGLREAFVSRQKASAAAASAAATKNKA